jgi:multidrug efflux pump subunit AcrA (membrane-fusion protein)
VPDRRSRQETPARVPSNSVVAASDARETTPFRSAAVLAAAGAGASDPLRLAPAWSARALSGLLLLVLAILASGLLIRVSRTTRAPAFLHLQGARAIVATSNGVVDSIDVVLGSRVVRGTTLVRLSARSETADRERLEAEYRVVLGRRLLDPNASETGDSLRAVAAQLGAARQHEEERTVRAPSEGRITGLHVRPGVAVTSGQVLVELADPDAPLEAVIAVPAASRPRISTGTRLRLHVEGFAETAIPLQVAAIDPTLLGSDEARRVLGSEEVEGPLFEGPVALAHVSLPTASLIVGRRTYQLLPGMRGTADLELERAPLFTGLLRAFTERQPRKHR